MRRSACLLTLCALLACPAAALAQSSETGYENVPGVPVPPETVPAPPPTQTTPAPPTQTTPAPPTQTADARPPAARRAPTAPARTTTTGPAAVVLGGGGQPPTPGPSAVPVASPPARAAQLPFTGLDLGLIALAGVALLMAGVVIRRVAGMHVDGDA